MSAPQAATPCPVPVYSTVTLLLKRSRRTAATTPTIRQMTFGSAVAPFQKLEKGMIITVAAITIPMIPWKAKE